MIILYHDCNHEVICIGEKNFEHPLWDNSPATIEATQRQPLSFSASYLCVSISNRKQASGGCERD